MENDYRVNIVSLEMDRDAEASAESTLSNSLESGVTLDSSRGDADTKLDECAGWTNEKHNSYLDYLENSFVSQLYSLLGGETQKPSIARDVQAISHKSTDQFTVLKNGCWQKVNFGKKRSHLEMSSESHLKKNSLRGNLATKGNVLCNEQVENSRNSVGHAYLPQSTAEASGQNFREGEEKGCDSEVSRKRKREAKCDDSSLKDQVVPF